MDMKPTNSMFGIHEAALKVHTRRLDMLASNIANADTPGYLARDIDFRQALAQVQNGGSPGDLEPMYRIPLQPTRDGNTVDLQQEQAAFAENSVRYQATLMFINSRISGLRTALTGE